MNESHPKFGTARNDDSLISRVLADWYTANPRIRRACAYQMRDDVDERGGSEIHILLDVEPVMDSEEILPVWLAHSGAWQLELQARTARTVHLGWLSPGEAAIPSLVGGRLTPRSIGVWFSRNDG
jgi:hypothetical protein